MAVEGDANHTWTLSALQLRPKGLIICGSDPAVESKAGTVSHPESVEDVNLEPVQL